MAVHLKSVFISDAVDSLCVQLLQKNGIKVVCKYKLPISELLSEIKNHDGLIVRSDTKVTSEVLAAATSLRVIGRAGTGVDNIDLEAATKRGIIVMNAPGGNSISACELTCALISNMARNVSQGTASLKKGAWERKNFMGSELSGKTLAVLGLGRIGREVATRMQAFGMKTVGFDPLVSTEDAREFNVKKLELEEIWPQADYITVHTPLIPQTRNLINDSVLAKCKAGVKIVNVARGGIVDELALLRALQSGQCGGAALDVFVEEPPKSKYYSELLQHPRVVCTPHLGASTGEAQQRVAVEIAEQFVALSQGGSVAGVVNAPILASALQIENAPWIKLAQSLGCVASSFVPSSLPGVRIQVTTFGHGLEKLKFLSTAVLVGQLAGITQNGINMINAPSLAKEAGIEVISDHRDDVPSLISAQRAVRITISQDQVTHSLSGTVKDGSPYLLSINDVVFDNGVAFGGNLLLFEGPNNQTGLPGVVAELVKQGAVLSRINMASGKNGRVWLIVSTASPVQGAESAKLPEGIRLVYQHVF